MKLAFIKYDTSLPLDEITINAIVDGINRTPSDFKAPPEEVINKLIDIIDKNVEDCFRNN